MWQKTYLKKLEEKKENRICWLIPRAGVGVGWLGPPESHGLGVGKGGPSGKKEMLLSGGGYSVGQMRDVLYSPPLGCLKFPYRLLFPHAHFTTYSLKHTCQRGIAEVSSIYFLQPFWLHPFVLSSKFSLAHCPPLISNMDMGDCFSLCRFNNPFSRFWFGGL